MSDADPADLPDEELLALRAKWEEERSHLWQHVSRHTGADYIRQYENFMARKQEAEAVNAELRVRGRIRRGRPPGSGNARTSAPPTKTAARDFSSSFDFEHTSRSVRTRSDVHVRFEEKDRIALREALRAAVARVHLEEDEILGAAFVGPKPTAGTDIENLLLYNLGLPAHPLRHGVAFEHVPETPADRAVAYEYEPVPETRPFRFWEPQQELVTWARVPVAKTTAAATWWALRRTGQARATAAVHDPLLVRMRVAAPRALGVNDVKGLVDGSLAATQGMPGVPRERARLVARALADLPEPPDEETVHSALEPDARSVLGTCASLISSDGRINPDDHRLVAGAIVVDIDANADFELVEASLHVAGRIGQRP